MGDEFDASQKDRYVGNWQWEYVGPHKKKVPLTPQVRALRERARMGLGPATSSDTAKRINIIANLMRTDEWNTEAKKKLQKEWVLSKSRIDQIAAEASRWTAQECTDVKMVTQTVAETLAQKLHQSRELATLAFEKVKRLDKKSPDITAPLMKDASLMFGAVERLADTWTKVVGARAPDAHEIVVVFENLSTDDKIKWIDERIEKLELAKQKIMQSKPKELQDQNIITVEAEPTEPTHTNGVTNGSNPHD